MIKFNKILNIVVIGGLLSFLVCGLPTQARVLNKKIVKKVLVVKKTTNIKKVVAVKSKSVPIKMSKTSSKVKKNSQVVSTKTPAFSAKEAAQSVSPSGKTPPPGYMEALKKAEDDYFLAKARARGNKAKLDEALANYDQALEQAQQMLN